MRTEDDLRNALRMSGAAPGNEAGMSIDTDAVLARSRRRRLPKRLALGGTVSLVVLGVGVAGFSGLSTVQSLTAADSAGGAAEAPSAPREGSAQSGSGAVEGASSLAPAEKVNACGGTVAEVAGNEPGLRLEPVFPERLAASTTGGSVRLTNTGDTRVTGSTRSTPAVTVSQDGVVLWHTNGPLPTETVAVDLDPGESVEYPATVDLVRCDVEDDTRESFRSDLPPLPAGRYDISALIEFTPSDPAAVPSLVPGPVQVVTFE